MIMMRMVERLGKVVSCHFEHAVHEFRFCLRSSGWYRVIRRSALVLWVAHLGI